MGFHLYCIVPADHGATPPAGIAERAVRPIEVGDALAVWASDHSARPRAAIDSVRVHNAVVEAAGDERVTPVPVRFGQWLDTEQAVRDAIRERAAWYAELLEVFAGALEFGVRILQPELERPRRPRPEAPTGRQYLAALAERSRTDQVIRRRGEEVAARLGEALGPLVRRARTEPLDSVHGLVSAAYLVGRHDFGGFHARMRTFRDQSPELRFLTTGPWPPYSFVE